MGVYVGLDVSLKQTSVCVIDEAGKVGAVRVRPRSQPLPRC